MLKFQQKHVTQRRKAAGSERKSRDLLRIMVLVGKEEPENDFSKNSRKLKFPKWWAVNNTCDCYVLPELGVVDLTPETYSRDNLRLP
jgi:hypothetical protein